MSVNPNEVEPVEAPEPKFFYTTNTPHRWSSGAVVDTLDKANGYEPIASLERAKELALEHKVGGYSEDHCDTTYGVMYST